jgi:hypothetical protein
VTARMLTPATITPVVALMALPIRWCGIGGVGHRDDELLGGAGAVWASVAAVLVSVMGGTAMRCSSLSVCPPGPDGFEADHGFSRA